ncbi:hypothetical protein TEA_029201 [Camellia sinensis var. sinensis]|uniref:Uncharacterized protein n=1 Tax=Camellia sinensis var. sinensis TaxID=542762 RepID=A0A4S4D6D4_CAMSN|nr:hypothetical protein TEA_029201 [Camellia sinensis var. sinensis]
MVSFTIAATSSLTGVAIFVDSLTSLLRNFYSLVPRTSGYFSNDIKIGSDFAFVFKISSDFLCDFTIVYTRVILEWCLLLILLRSTVTNRASGGGDNRRRQRLATLVAAEAFGKVRSIKRQTELNEMFWGYELGSDFAFVFKISSDFLCDFTIVYTRDCCEVTHFIEMAWLFKEGKEVTRRSISCLINLGDANCHGDSTVAATSIGYTNAVVINTSF